MKYVGEGRTTEKMGPDFIVSAAAAVPSPVNERGAPNRRSNEWGDVKDNGAKILWESQKISQNILYTPDYHYVSVKCLKVCLEMTKLGKFRMRLHDIFCPRWTTHTRLSIDWEHVSQSTWPRYETLERTLTYLVPVATAQFAYPFDTTYTYVYMHNFWVLHKHQW